EGLDLGAEYPRAATGHGDRLEIFARPVAGPHLDAERAAATRAGDVEPCLRIRRVSRRDGDRRIVVETNGKRGRVGLGRDAQQHEQLAGVDALVPARAQDLYQLRTRVQV